MAALSVMLAAVGSLCGAIEREAVFPTLYGKVRCSIPPGTQSGSKIRIKNKGIVSMKNKGQYGDEYVMVQVSVPKNPTPQEKEKLRELAQLEKAS